MTQEVRELAKGKWPSIHSALGLQEHYLKAHHGPCPVCGGTGKGSVLTTRSPGEDTVSPSDASDLGMCRTTSKPVDVIGVTLRRRVSSGLPTNFPDLAGQSTLLSSRCACKDSCTVRKGRAVRA